MTRCKICNKRIWFTNVKYWAYATPFDCCEKCANKYDFNDDYTKWNLKKKGIEQCWQEWQ